MVNTKKDLVDRMAAVGYTKKAANVIVDDVFGIISDMLTEGEQLQIIGFGKFEIRQMGERETIDVVTGKRIVIPSYRLPRFVPGGALRQRVKEGVIRD